MVRTGSVSASIGGAALAAALLAGCGSVDDGAAASPSSAASTGVPASPEPSSGATPADYVPASLEGPAQNVPKPVMPELAKEESRAGAQAFLDYWSDAKWYAYQTGDTSYARNIISPHCDVCMDELNQIENLYQERAWAIDGRESITLREKELAPAHDGIHKPVVTSTYEGITVVDGGEVVLTEPPEEDPEDAFQAYLDLDKNQWVYITAAPMPGTR